MKRIVPLLATLCLSQISFAANVVPDAISYQGRALTATGALMGAGTPVNRIVIFRIWDHPSNSLFANLVYSEQQTVTIAEGEFSVLLGTGSATAGTPLTYSETTKGRPAVVISSAFAGTSRYLGVTIDDGVVGNTDNEISPRQQMVSGAFAMRAKVAESVDGLAITSTMLANSSVNTIQLGDAAVTTNKLAAGAVTATQLSDATITSSKLAANSVTATQIAASAVGTSQIDDLTIATADLAAGAVTTAKIATDTILATNIAAGAVGTSEILDGAVATADIADLTIATADLAAGAVTTAKIATDTILATNIAAGAVATSELATGVDISAGTLSTTGNVTTTGNIGIGTTSPATQLHINGGAGTLGPVQGKGALYLQDSGALAGNGGSLLFGASQGVYAGIKGFAVDGTTHTVGDLVFYTRRLVADTNLSESMRIKVNGNIQIGTTSNQARLSIGIASGTYATIGYLDTTGGQSGDTLSATYATTSIYADGRIVAPYFGATSDLRIKTDLHPTDSGKDLETLMGIEVTDYQYKDKLALGNGPQKKVIAQQVEKVYPQAVNTAKGVVPDIFKKATVQDGWIELATDLKVGERVRLISEKEEGVHEVLEVKADKFLTPFKPAGNQVFVYGREVNDFRSVDYDAIAMLNVSATQQLKHDKDAEIQGLARQLEAVQAENAALRRELAAKDESVEARLIALEARFSKDGAPVTVSLKTVSAAK
jgi:hypothetical protein